MQPGQDIGNLSYWQRLRAIPPRERLAAARLAAAIVDRSSTADLLSILDPPVNWIRLAEAARALRIAPMVDASLLRLDGRIDVLGSVKKALWLEAEQWRFWNRRLAREGEGVLDSLSARGFRVVPIKGFDYARRLYPEIELRPMVDIDLFLPEDELGPACDYLTSCSGFREEAGAVLTGRAQYYRKRVLARGEKPAITGLDVHSVFYHPELYPVDYAGVWRRMGADNPGLTPEDSLLMSCLILAKDRYQLGMRDLVDIHGILHRWRPDWSVVLDRARAWGMTVPLFFSLSAARSLLASPVPDHILRACRPGWLRHTWLNLFLETDSIPIYRYDHGETLPKLVLRIPLSDSKRSWWAFLRAHVRFRVGQRSVSRARGAGT